MKIKGEPGDYIPYEQVVEKLKAPAYGAIDLVELGLFHSEHFVRDAMNSGQLKFHKINKRAVIICREHLLEYWKNYRSIPFEPANNIMQIKMTISEADYIASLVNQGQKRIDREFTKDDLFRNIIHFMKKNGTNVESQPYLFTKRL